MAFAQSRSSHAAQSGNVLFLILIAVALFAAVTYAVTSSSRTGGGDSANEQTDMIASQIIQYGEAVKQGFLRLRTTNNCPLEQIAATYTAPAWLGAYNTNSQAPTNFRCHLFRPEGAGLVTFQWNQNYFSTPDSTLVVYGPPRYYSFTGNLAVTNEGLATGAELLGILPGLTLDICRAINRKANVNPPNYDPTGFTTAWHTGWVDGTLTTHGQAPVNFQTTQSGFSCIRWNSLSGQPYTFVQTILAQ